MRSSIRTVSRPAYLIVKLGEWTAARFTERLAPLGLRPRHLGVLHLLSEAPRSQFELAGTIGVAASVVVDMIDELEALGAVRRDPDQCDRRRHSLTLTVLGRDLLERADDISRQVEGDLLAGLDPTLRTPLSRGLRELGRSRGILTSPTSGRTSVRPDGDAPPTEEQG